MRREYIQPQLLPPTAKVGANCHIGPYAVISDHATVGDNATILPHVVIYGHATIGNNFFAHAHAIVREYCQLGDNVTLQNGAIIGADGYGFARDPLGPQRFRLVQDSPVRPRHPRRTT